MTRRLALLVLALFSTCYGKEPMVGCTSTDDDLLTEAPDLDRLADLESLAVVGNLARRER